MEFSSLDADLSEGIELAEFVTYIASLATWLRTQLHADFHQRSIFELLASRAAGIVLPPMALPTPTAPPLPPPPSTHHGATRRVSAHSADERGVELGAGLGAAGQVAKRGGHTELVSTIHVSKRFVGDWHAVVVAHTSHTKTSTSHGPLAPHADCAQVRHQAGDTGRSAFR